MARVCEDELVRRSPFSDYTLPRVSLIRARRGAAMLRRVFGDTHVEELSRPFYAVSADLIASRLVVHRRGPLSDAVAASMSIPGLAPPHPLGAQLLVDGGVLNNLPVDLMDESDEGPIVAIDVIRRLEQDGLGAAARTVPSITEILARATVLASVERAERNRKLAVLTITPDVQAIGLREFSQLRKAIDEGRRAGSEALAAGGAERLREALRTGSRARRDCRKPDRVNAFSADSPSLYVAISIQRMGRSAYCGPMLCGSGSFEAGRGGPGKSAVDNEGRGTASRRH